MSFNPWEMQVCTTEGPTLGEWGGLIPLLFVPLTEEQILQHPNPDASVASTVAPTDTERPYLVIMNVTQEDLPRIHVENGKVRWRVRDIQDILRSRARRAGKPIVDNVHENRRKAAADRVQLDAEAAAVRARMKADQLTYPGSF